VNIKLIKTKGNTREIPWDKSEDDDPPMNSFFAISEDFGNAKDSYVQVSSKQLKIYNAKL